METDEEEEDNATEMCKKQSEMGIVRFGRMETDEEEDEDNVTEMCTKQSEMCFGRFGKWKQMMEDDDATELVMRNLKWVLENLLLFEKILNFEHFSNNNFSV
jgi:hypothetical protein